MSSVYAVCMSACQATVEVMQALPYWQMILLTTVHIYKHTTEPPTMPKSLPRYTKKGISLYIQYDILKT